MTTSEAAGSQIGRYKLLEQIGEGGMGTIWLAEQREPVRRRVALKIIKLGMDTKQVIARFEAERQALAMMDHPNIAKVLDAGSTETGRPYFVMEYIKGIPILEYCDTERVDTPARLELFASVCHAIQHAHQKGIIHRDIKPSNVLVTLHDGVPMPKVIDFGIAKATNSELTTKTLFTEHRQMIGTPAYMSPEQAEMSGLDIDTRSDIYSLGVLLYELLTGTTPFNTKALLESGFDEMLRAIREDEPHKPSTRISKLGDTGTRTAQQRRVEVKKLGMLLRGDLDWIVMKCLEKDRTRRYETANGLAADLRRHLNDEPVTAGAPSATYKLRKFIRRNRVQVIAASVVVAALLAGVVAASWGLVQTSRARSATLQRQLDDEQRSTAEKARLGRNAEAVAALLGQCEEAVHAGDASKAMVALDAARKRTADGGADEHAERVERLAADLELSTELDAIDQYRWTWTEHQFGNEEVAATRTHEVLRDFGADPDFDSVAEAATRVETSAIRERLVLVMNRLLLTGQEQKEGAEALRDLLHRVDPDPFRDAFRDAVVARDASKVLLSARAADVLAQPPEFIAALGQSGVLPEERRRELLQSAVIRRPSDIALLMTLQGLPSLNSVAAAQERIRWLQAAIAADPRNFAGYTNLGSALRETGQSDKSLACYRRAIEVDPGSAMAFNNLGAALNGKGRHAEALPSLRKSVALDPTQGLSLSNLGEALVATGEVDEGIACYRKAIAADPKDAYAHAVLADALRGKGELDLAIASYRKSIELDPSKAAPHGCLGELLARKGEADEGLACLRKAVELDPKAAWWQGKLGEALRNRGQMDEAIACFRKSIELDPTNATVHVALGIALHDGQQLDAAIACFRKAIELDPNLAAAHHDLGAALVESGRSSEALASYRRAAELEPTEALPQLDLAVTLHALGQHDAALVAYQRTLELDPNDAVAHCKLAACLQNLGRFAEAVPFMRRGHELGSKLDDWRNPSAEWVRAAEMRAALEAKLPALLAGEIAPVDDAERLEYATMCRVKGLHHSAVALFAEAFAHDSRLADDLGARYRYRAALCAALASAGRSNDAAQLDDRERARLRKQASDWLWADLELHAKSVATGKPEERAAVEEALRGWQEEADLSCIRDPAELDLLPAAELDGLEQLWADVESLLAKAQSQGSGPR
jgi:tetratricopeptide (TPR) repeat protein